MNRRDSCRLIGAGLLSLNGCGSGSSNSTPSASQDPSSAVPPNTGGFGGGQGKILYVESGYNAKIVREVDLANRRVKTLPTIDRGGSFGLVGGVTRASTGAFLVTDYAASSLTDVSKAYLYSEAGALLQTFTLTTMVLSGATLSPDGRTIACVYPARGQQDGRTGTAVFLRIFEVGTGASIAVALVEPGAASDEIRTLGINSMTVWGPDSTLYAVVPGNLYRVDRATGAIVRLHDMPSTSTGSLAVTHDGREIWYESEQDSPYGTSLWSIDLASGARRQRTVRSLHGRQYGPGFSPDGQWLLLKQGRLSYVGAIIEYPDVCAIRLGDSRVDTQNLTAEVLDSNGNSFQAKGAMAWF